MRIQPWDISTRDGRKITVRPLTVRQRIALTNELASDRATEAQADASLSGLDAKATLEHVQKARREALIASALILDCYTLRGAMRVVAASTELSEPLSSTLEPKELTELALSLLGFGEDDRESEDAPKGK